MRTLLQRLPLRISSALFGIVFVVGATSTLIANDRSQPMDLGQFSVSLTVKDLQVSRDFYEKLSFVVMPKGGEGGSWDSYEKDWVILEKDTVVIGLFQGMFDQNILTFNPLDVRGVQKGLKENGVEFTMEADETTTGPASAMLADPDGNPILLDQHH